MASNGLIADNTAPRTTASDGTRWSQFTAQDDTLEIELGQIIGGVAGDMPKYTVSFLSYQNLVARLHRY